MYITWSWQVVFPLGIFKDNYYENFWKIKHKQIQDHFCNTEGGEEMISKTVWKKLFKEDFNFLTLKVKDIILTHSFPMHPFSTPWKHPKTVRFSDVFKG